MKIKLFHLFLTQIKQVSKIKFKFLIYLFIFFNEYCNAVLFFRVMAQIRELEPVLCQADRTSQLIWTSSSNAHRSAFNLEDIQHQRGTQPYSSSKYASDLLSLALNTHYNKQVDCHMPHMLCITHGLLFSFFLPPMMTVILLLMC